MLCHRQCFVVVHHFISDHFNCDILKKTFSLYFALLQIACKGFGQIIDKNPNDFDTLLLSNECNLDKKQSGKIFTKLEIYAEFAGGFQKWFAFANRNFDFDYVANNLSDAVTIFQDSIIVKFIVARNGTVCNIKFQKGNPLLTGPIQKLLESSPNWKPGTIGGRQLNSYRTLRIDVFIDKSRHEKSIKHFMNSYFRDNS